MTAPIYNFISFHAFMKNHYEQKKQANSNWSYTVWANSLGLKSSSTLIMLTQGVRNPSDHLTARLVNYFKFSQNQSQYFKQLIFLQKNSENLPLFLESMAILKKLNPGGKFRLVSLENFETLSNWYYFAIRELVDTNGFKNDEQWIQDKLLFPVSIANIRRALLTLERLGYITKTLGQYSYSQGYIHTPCDIENAAIKNYHRQVLELGKVALNSQSVDQREFTGGCMTINQADIAELKAKINHFKMELMETYGKASADSVYQMEFLLFPLSRTASDQ